MTWREWIGLWVFALAYVGAFVGAVALIGGWALIPFLGALFVAGGIAVTR